MAQLSAQGGRHAEAAALWKRALKLDPGFFQARYLLGNLLKSRGELEQAAACYRRVIAQQPGYTQAHFTFAGIHRYENLDDPHIVAMQRLYRDSSLPDENRIQLAFALAKALEDCAEYAGAFDFLEAGNRLRHKAFNYEISSDRELFKNIIETFSADAVAAVSCSAEQSNRPVFIVGMPRSGTSLVEKILATHRYVHGAGEIDDFYSLAARSFLDPRDHYQYRPLPACPSRAFERLGQEYLDRINALNSRAARVTDKLPFNLLMVGLIRLALPNATIIHCRRDARDTCLSLYKQNFTTANYRFAYDLKTIGQFYRLYHGLMAHWGTVFPGIIHDVSYEELTRNPETEIRKLLDACGLAWEEECLAFDRSPATVTTASAVQVRRPLYTSSIGLWKRYGDRLAPLLEELEKTGPPV
jgi:tetratricopeptide (TPR) repeat protein